MCLFILFIVLFSIFESKAIDFSGYSQVNYCDNKNDKIDCWGKQLDKTLEKKGLPQTFDLMASLYMNEPQFASECHNFAHQIGYFAYQKFTKGQGFDLNSKTSYCGYGFYHGFMEKMFQNSGNIKEAQDFCKYVGEKLAGETTDGEGACYHGIGHGTVDGGNSYIWGDPNKMIKSGIELCEKVALGDHSQYGKLYRCVTGAYNAIEILSHIPKYKLQEFEKDPFSLCPSQKDEYKEACYTNMIPAILINTNNDLLKSEKFIENIKESGYEIRKPVTSGLFVEFYRMNLNKPNQNIEEGIRVCQSIKNPLRLSCFYGLSEGFMKYGEPQKAYINGLNFCHNNLLKDDEKDTCYNSILSRLRVWYSVDKSKEICSGVLREFQKYCSL